MQTPFAGNTLNANTAHSSFTNVELSLTESTEAVKPTMSTMFKTFFVFEMAQLPFLLVVFAWFFIDLCDRVRAYMCCAALFVVCICTSAVIQSTITTNLRARLNGHSCVDTLALLFMLTMWFLEFSVLTESPECTRSGYSFIFMQVHAVVHVCVPMVCFAWLCLCMH